MTSAGSPGAEASGLEGAYNFRDLGGLPTSSGGVTRHGRLFRSDTLQALTDRDVASLTEVLGLRSIVDLRLLEEVEQLGRGPLAGRVRHVHAPLPMAAIEGVAPERVLDHLYVSCLESPFLVEALAAVMSAADEPVVFHCAAGKDRTGIVAGLLLALAGVSEPAIVDDYLRSRSAMPSIVARFRSWPYYSRHIDRTPPEVYEVDAAPLLMFFATLRRQFGDVPSWARAKGLDDAAIRHLRACLVI